MRLDQRESRFSCCAHAERRALHRGDDGDRDEGNHEVVNDFAQTFGRAKPRRAATSARRRLTLDWKGRAHGGTMCSPMAVRAIERSQRRRMRAENGPTSSQ
jgi:hypothetical protein